jgi:Flp pilus assembly pilin Flp
VRRTLERVRGPELPSRLRAQEGQGTVEYGLLIAAGAVLVIAAMLFMAGNVDRLFRKPGETHVFRPPVGQCDASYDGACVPPAPPDLSCHDLVDRGIPTPVRVVGEDPHELDGDGDGWGC